MSPAVRTLERGAGRAGKAVVGRVGLPVAAAIAVAIVVVIAVVEGLEGGSCDRPRRRDGAAHDIARYLTGAGRPAIHSPARQGGVGVTNPLAAVGRVTLNVALAFCESLRSLGLGLSVLRTLVGHGTLHATLGGRTLGHRRAREHGDDNGRGAKDGKTCSLQSRHWTLPFP